MARNARYKRGQCRLVLCDAARTFATTTLSCLDPFRQGDNASERCLRRDTQSRAMHVPKRFPGACGVHGRLFGLIARTAQAGIVVTRVGA